MSKKKVFLKIKEKFEFWLEDFCNKRLPEVDVEDSRFYYKYSKVLDKCIKQVLILIHIFVFTLIFIISFVLSYLFQNNWLYLMILPASSFASIGLSQFRGFLRRFEYDKKSNVMTKQKQTMIDDLEKRRKELINSIKSFKS